MSWLKPASGPISSPFGPRVAPIPGATTFHEGADIAAANGSKCIASAAGTVTTAGLSGGWGGLVVIDHGDGHSTYCAHLSRIDVKRGQKVTQGQQIGLTGGRLGQWGAGTSTGSHCHTEHRINGKPVDPVPFWSATTPAGASGTPVNTEKDEDMLIYVSSSASKDGVIPKGFSFIQDASGPLRPLSAAEWGAYDYWRAHGIPVRVADWTGDMIRAVTVTVGLRQWSALGDNNPVLTGKIIYADPAQADYPKVSGGAAAVVNTSELVAALIEALPKKIVGTLS